MKLCITAHGGTLDSPIDERFGRAEFFVLINTETMALETISNSKAQDAHGVGIASGSLIASAGVEALLTGHCGPKALEVLTAGGVRVFNGAQGTVREAIEAFHQGQLSEVQVSGNTR